MGAADLEVAEAESVHHFRGAGDEGDDSHSPNIALAFFGRLLFEQFFELLGMLLGLAKGGDLQEADLELDLGCGVHSLLYRD